MKSVHTLRRLLVIEQGEVVLSQVGNIVTVLVIDRKDEANFVDADVEDWRARIGIRPWARRRLRSGRSGSRSSCRCGRLTGRLTGWLSCRLRSLTACATSWIGMKLKRKLTWNPEQEMFVGDDEANAMRERKARSTEYDFNVVMQNAGLV